MANNYTHACVLLKTDEEGKRRAADKLDLLISIYEEQMDEFVGFDLSFVDEGVLVHHDESIDVDKAANFIAWFLWKTGSEEKVILDFCCYCDKTRPGEFGGGSILIDKTGVVDFCNPTQLMMDKAKKKRWLKSYDDVDQALEDVYGSENPVDKLLSIVEENVQFGEFGFASELLKEFGGREPPRKTAVKASKPVWLWQGPLHKTVSFASGRTVFMNDELYVYDAEQGEHYDPKTKLNLPVFVHAKSLLNQLPYEVWDYERQQALEIMKRGDNETALEVQLLGAPQDRVNAWLQLLTHEPEYTRDADD